MAYWNWDLRDRFKLAADQLGYEVECNWSFYKMKIPGQIIWCYLWHPANKMRHLYEGNNADPELALKFIKDNQDDFHIELDREPRLGSGISHLFPELWNNPSTAIIVDCIKRALDPKEVAELEFLDSLQGEE